MTGLPVKPMARHTAAAKAGFTRRRDKRNIDARLFRVHAMGMGQASFIALAGLLLAFAVALAAMTGVGAFSHLLTPDRPFDAYAIFHNNVVLLSLVSLAALWLLPPHPWAKELVYAPLRDDPAPRPPVPVGKPRFTVVSTYQSRAPPHLGLWA
jgi:hypothetical protein